MKTNKIISLLMAAFLALPIAMTGCNFMGNNSESVGDSTNGDSTSSGNQSGIINAYEEEKTNQHYVEGTLHDVNVDFNNPVGAFVTNAMSAYKVVASGDETTEAATYVLGKVLDGTGAMLGKEDNASSVVVTKSTKYIIFGCQDKFEEAGLTMPTYDVIGVSGYYIKTWGSNVFIQAYSKHGYQMAALAFLRETLGFDMMSEDLVIYEKDGAVMPEMEITERPDFDYRQASNSISVTADYGLGYNGRNLWISPGGHWVHNALYFTDDATKVNHPKWFSDDAKKAQPCWNAHGDEEEYALMVETYTQSVINFMIAEPHKNNIMISQMDGTAGQPIRRCTCTTCNASFEYYGDTLGGAALSFINDVSEGVEAYLKSPEGLSFFGEDKEMNIYIIVYGMERTPPLERDEKGYYMFDENGFGIPKYECTFDENGEATQVLDEDGNPVRLKCSNLVNIFYASSGSDYTNSFYDVENQKYASEIMGWAGLGKKFAFWAYERNYWNYLYPYNSYDSNFETMRFFKSMGASYIYWEGTWENPNGTSFCKLNDYLDAKCAFNVNYNYYELLDKWFTHYFKEASVPMRKYFDAVTTRCREMEYYIGGAVHSDKLAEASVWPEGLINTFMGYFDEAYKAIEKYQASDPDMYEVLRKHILIESLFPRWVLCTTYENSFGEEDLRRIRTEFLEDFYNLQNTTHKEAYKIEDVTKFWDVDM